MRIPFSSLQKGPIAIPRGLLIGEKPSEEAQKAEQAQKAADAIAKGIGQLSIGMYAQLAVAHIATLDDEESVDREKCRELAKQKCLVAARCYFEGIGVIAVEEEKEE